MKRESDILIDDRYQGGDLFRWGGVCVWGLWQACFDMSFMLARSTILFARM
jgi:hypothetical protein